MDPDHKTILEARNLRKVFGGLVAVDNVSIAIRKQTMHAIIGPNGAGKTTLFNCISGLYRPTGGRIHFDGTDITGLGEEALARLRGDKVGIVFQFFHLLPSLTAYENILVPMEIAGVADAFARAQDELAAVGLASRMQHYPAQMSGGEQQRVAFCRALANAPRLLLADEPTGNLDPATSDQVFGALMELVRGTGMAALIATHNMELAARMDRIVRLDQGRVV